MHNYNLSRSPSQSQSAHLPAQQLRVKESEPQTQRLKLHDLKRQAFFLSTTQTGQSETQAGELREFKRATSYSEAQQQEVKEPQQELTRSTTETHRVKAKESRSSTTETQGVKAKRSRVKTALCRDSSEESQNPQTRDLRTQTHSQNHPPLAFRRRRHQNTGNQLTSRVVTWLKSPSKRVTASHSEYQITSFPFFRATQME